jgi:hypothetical protein
MLFRKRESTQRFYLLPGQGGKNYYLKQRRFIAWSIFVSLLFGAVLAAVMWYFSKPRL